MKLRFHISQRHLLYVLGGLLLMLVVITIIGERGAIHLWRLRGEKIRIDEQNYRLQKENETLRQRVLRIRHDKTGPRGTEHGPPRGSHLSFSQHQTRQRSAQSAQRGAF